MIKIYSLLKIYIIVLLVLVLYIISSALFAQETRQLAVDKPQAIADLRTNEGAALVDAKWYVRENKLHPSFQFYAFR